MQSETWLIRESTDWGAVYTRYPGQNPTKRIQAPLIFLLLSVIIGTRWIWLAPFDPAAPIQAQTHQPLTGSDS